MSVLRSFYHLALVCILVAGCKSEGTNHATENIELQLKDSTSQNLSQIDSLVDTLIVDQFEDVSTVEQPQDSVKNRKVSTKDQSPYTSNEPDTRNDNKSIKRPVIQFENEFVDFGDIEEGEIIKEKFVFTNKGNAPLEILSAKGSCGCTQPSYPFIAVPPGESGYIGVEYNSIGKWGEQNVNIRIKTNSRSADYILYMKGFVNEKPKEIQTEKDSLTKSSY